MKMDTMVDIEAMGKSPDGAILSIGAVSFDPMRRIINLERTFYERVSLASALKCGMKVEGETVYWWLNQSEEARKEVSRGGWPLFDVLSKFLLWWGLYGGEGIWAHGVTYDIPIIEHAIRLTDLYIPWKYGEIYDTRALFKSAGITYKGVAHHALTDAIAQAKAVIEAYDILGNRKEGAV